MRIIVFSDIHGNQYAFDAFLDELKKRKYDYLFFCGDIYGYYYGQHSIIQKMRQLKKFYAVKGNHDALAIEIAEGRKEPENYFQQYGHSYAMLQREDITYVKNLPVLLDLELEGRKIAVLHGTMENPLHGRMYPKDAVQRQELYQEYDYVFCGHTHFQMIRHSDKTTIFNAGSLGQQRDGKGFCYLYFDTVKESAEYRNIRYDMVSLENEVKRYDPDNKKMIDILHRGEA